MTTLPPRSTYSRTAIYLENRQQQPKHMFVVLADMIARRAIPAAKLLDVGAASGDFLAYCRQHLPDTDLCGVEIDPQLVSAARDKLPWLEIAESDAQNMTAIAAAGFDIVTMTGVHSIFDDFRPSFRECLRVAKPGGLVIITGLFNPYPVDALIHWRLPSNEQAGWHPGYNFFSMASVSGFISGDSRVSSHRYHAFTLPFDLPAQQDPIRSWTEPPDDAGRRSLRNGLMPLPCYILEIELAA